MPETQLSASTVEVFVIGLFHEVGPNSTPESTEGPRDLAMLVRHAGGRIYTPERTGDMVGIIRQLQAGYMVTYSPQPALVDGTHHDIEVKLTAARGVRNLSATYRPSFVATAQ